MILHPLTEIVHKYNHHVSNQTRQMEHTYFGLSQFDHRLVLKLPAIPLSGVLAFKQPHSKASLGICEFAN